jgi:predicted metal-dependent phosphotriesterase family hydrolase
MKSKLIINNKKLLSRKKMKEMTNKNSMKAMYVAPMVEMMNARVEKGFEGTEAQAGIEDTPDSGIVYNFD